VIDTPEKMMALVEALAEERPDDPDEYLRTEMQIDPEIMGEFHMLDLRDTIHTIYEGRSGTDPFEPVMMSAAQIVSIIAAHGTVLLQAGHQLGRKQRANG
jgi:hypothetical protein